MYQLQSQGLLWPPKETSDGTESSEWEQVTGAQRSGAATAGEASSTYCQCERTRGQPPSFSKSHCKRALPWTDTRPAGPKQPHRPG